MIVARDCVVRIKKYGERVVNFESRQLPHESVEAFNERWKHELEAAYQQAGARS